MMDTLTSDEQKAVRQAAIDRCDHEDKWVSATENGYTADACWACILDAYFEHLGV